MPEKGYKRAGEGFLPRARSDKTRDNGFQQKKSRSRFDSGRKFFTFGVMGHRLPREAVKLEVLKAELAGALSNLWKLSLPVEGELELEDL